MRLVVILLLGSIAGAWAGSFDARFEEIKNSATRRQLYAFLYGLPKGGDLHHHLGLAILPEEWLEAVTEARRSRGDEFYTRLAFKNCPGDSAPLIRFQSIQGASWRELSECRKGEYAPLAGLSPELKAEWISSLKLDRPGEGRDEFFDVIFPRVVDLIRDAALLSDVLPRVLKRHAAEGLRYLESQATAVSLRDREGRPLGVERGSQVLRDVLNRPDVKASGLTVRFLYTFLRFREDSERQLEDAYAFVNRNRDLWVGINFAGREDNDKGYALRFLETFRRMRRTYSGIHLSLHAGEKDSPGPEVRNTLMLGAERIGHGVNLISDRDTMLLMRNGKFLVEVQLISNRLLGYTPDLAMHPFPEYLRTGIPVCLNTDDPGVWDSNLTDEYFTAVSTFNLSWKEVVELGRNSLRYSFAEPELKQRLLGDYEAAVSAFERKYGEKNWRETIGGVKPAVSGYAVRSLGIR